MADVSVPTIKRLEAKDGPLGGRSDTGRKIRHALEIAGIEFIDENGGGPGCGYGSGNRRNDNGCGSRRSRAHRPDLVETARTRVDTQPARYSPTI